MKSILLYNQGGYSPELLAFNGETNFAISSIFLKDTW